MWFELRVEVSSMKCEVPRPKWCWIGWGQCGIGIWWWRALCLCVWCELLLLLLCVVCFVFCFLLLGSDGGIGRIAQSVERSANNAVVLGSSPSMTNLLIPEA